MFGTILQTTETPINVADSLRTVASSLATGLKENPNAVIQGLMEQCIHFGIKCLCAFAIYFIGSWIIRRIKASLRKMFAKKGTEATIVSFVMSFVTISLYVLLAIIAVSTLGINTTSLAALLAAGGMAIGMALSGTVQNFAGGIMILIFKPFKAGDFINAQGYSGVVQEVTMVSTKILTIDNRLVILPNGALSGGNVDNYSAKPLRRVDWTVNLAYGTDADKCMEAIKEILSGDDRILDASTPGAADLFVAVSNLNSSDISFTVRAWVKGSDYWDVYFKGNRDFYMELPKRGFNFAYPHVDVKIR